MKKGVVSMLREMCLLGSGGMSGVVTDDSETFRLGNLESEVVGDACGAADRCSTQPVLLKPFSA